MLKKIFLLFFAIIFVLVLSGFAYYHVNKTPLINEASTGGLYHSKARPIDKASLVSIADGELEGFNDSYNTFSWLGIPYAAPPVEELRWRSPQEVIKWNGVFQAVKHPSPCVQYWGQLAGVDGSKGEVVGAEDCLYLNVWAPRKALEPKARKRPVMVWIHGGGNDSGTANTYQAHNLSGTQDVVVVLLNYRLGLMGWFSHSAIRSQANNLADASGNFGTLDLIAGLEWVRDNISEFGGDPNNVTIFGESAGGKNVFSLLASPMAKGLFHKAISQSGSADTTLLTLAEDEPEPIAGKPISGLKNSSKSLVRLATSELYGGGAQSGSSQISLSDEEVLSALRSLSAERLMKIASKNLDEVDEIRSARVIRDGYVIPQQSVLDRLSQAATYNAVPLILGANRDENKLFMMGDQSLVENRFGIFPRIIDKDKYQRISDYVSKNWKAGAVDEPAKRIHSHGAEPTFAYRFDWDDSPNNWIADLPSIIGAAHGLEISFIFGDFVGGAQLGPLLDKRNASGREQLSDAMMQYWAEFAYTGNPNRGRSGNLPEWGAWSSEGHNLMIFDSVTDSGIRMAEVRDNVSDIKAMIVNDSSFETQSDRCEAYAALFLHGYQASDFWNESEYDSLGCQDYPAGIFRNG